MFVLTVSPQRQGQICNYTFTIWFCKSAYYKLILNNRACKYTAMFLLECDSRAGITLRFDLFEDVLSADWIYPDCRPERERERNTERVPLIRLHFRLRLLSVCKPTIMQRDQRDTEAQ